MRLMIKAVLLLVIFQVPSIAQDKAKVKCGPADADRILFTRADTTQALVHVPCGEEVEVMDNTGAVYKVRRSNGQIGYILGDAVDPSGIVHVASGSQSDTKPLTNADVMDMLDAGLSPEIIVAKIKASTCNFDTSPATLKLLKTKGVPDSVVLAMVEAPAVREETARPEPQSTKNTTSSSQTSAAPSDAASAASSDSTAAKQAEERKRQAAQKASDDLEDCRTRAQNEYETKMNALGTLAISPMMRVAAANKLKQNLDAELRACRSQYESRLKSVQ